MFDYFNRRPIMLTLMFVKSFLWPCYFMFRFSIRAILSMSKETSTCLEILIMVHFGM